MLVYDVNLVTTVTVCKPTFDAVVAATVMSPVVLIYNSVVVRAATPTAGESLIE
jgi:hypothetical protein